jgi:hypothetical protein
MDDILKAVNPALSHYPDLFYRNGFTPIFERRLVMDFGVQDAGPNKLPVLLKAAEEIDEALRAEGYVVEECNFGIDGFKLTVFRS